MPELSIVPAEFTQDSSPDERANPPRNLVSTRRVVGAIETSMRGRMTIHNRAMAMRNRKYTTNERQNNTHWLKPMSVIHT